MLVRCPECGAGTDKLLLGSSMNTTYARNRSNKFNIGHLIEHSGQDRQQVLYVYISLVPRPHPPFNVTRRKREGLVRDVT